MRKSLAGILATATALTLSSQSFAENYGFSGSMCRGTMTALVGTTPFWGIHNLSHLNGRDVVCASVLPMDSKVHTVFLSMYDRNTSETGSCSINLLDGNGLILSTKSVQAGSDTSSAHFLIATFPDIKSQSVYLKCYLPKKTTAGFSHLVAYRVWTR